MVLEETSTDFGTLGVKHNSALEVSSSLESFSELSDSFSVHLYSHLDKIGTRQLYLVVTVREVKSCDSHTTFEHTDECFDFPAGRTRDSLIDWGMYESYPIVQTILLFLTLLSVSEMMCSRE